MLRKHFRTARNVECYICTTLFHLAFEFLLDCRQAHLLPVSGFDDSSLARTIDRYEKLARFRSAIASPHSGEIVAVRLRQVREPKMNKLFEKVIASSSLKGSQFVLRATKRAAFGAVRR